MVTKCLSRLHCMGSLKSLLTGPRPSGVPSGVSLPTGLFGYLPVLSMVLS